MSPRLAALEARLLFPIRRAMEEATARLGLLPDPDRDGPAWAEAREDGLDAETGSPPTAARPGQTTDLAATPTDGLLPDWAGARDQARMDSAPGQAAGVVATTAVVLAEPSPHGVEPELPALPSARPGSGYGTALAAPASAPDGHQAAHPRRARTGEPPIPQSAAQPARIARPASLTQRARLDAAFPDPRTTASAPAIETNAPLPAPPSGVTDRRPIDAAPPSLLAAPTLGGDPAPALHGAPPEQVGPNRPAGLAASPGFAAPEQTGGPNPLADATASPRPAAPASRMARGPMAGAATIRVPLTSGDEPHEPFAGLLPVRAAPIAMTGASTAPLPILPGTADAPPRAHLTPWQDGAVAPVGMADPTLDRMALAIQPALTRAAELAGDGFDDPDDAELATPNVRNTFNVNVALSARIGPAERHVLQDALTDLLRDAARRQGLDL